MRVDRFRRELAMVALVVASSCARRPDPTVAPAPAPDSAVTAAIQRDRPERLVLPLAPRGAGEVVFVAVAPARAELDLPPPPAEAAEPPSSSSVTSEESAALELKPPIPRGIPRVVSGGRGGRVTLDVRVDETGQVSDAELVETDADSLTVLAATQAARALHYHPALLGQRRVAVWTRQVYDVARGLARRP